MVKVKQLDARLRACAGLVRRGSTVADIGTDHALLPAFLRLNGWTDIIATDIKPGPLEAARRTLERYGITDVSLILSDGFANVLPRDDVIIAGMGGEMIARILGGCVYKNADTRFILQPMTRQQVLRDWLGENNYEIITETAAQCVKKTYTIIYAQYVGDEA